MDIVAKHVPADKNGVRIAYLDEMAYRRQLWNHMPITDFWRVGKGYAKKLAAYQIYTVSDMIFNEAVAFGKFSVPWACFGIFLP